MLMYTTAWCSAQSGHFGTPTGCSSTWAFSSPGNYSLVWAILQYPGHLHREILIFSQKSLKTIYTYHLVPFKLPKSVQRGPFQGLLAFRYFFQKISIFTKYAITPLFFG